LEFPGSGLRPAFFYWVLINTQQKKGRTLSS
jgi:hypothetical protein